MSGFAVTVEGLSKRYVTAYTPALDDVSFALESGSVVAVAGPSGSGKSTLLHLIGAMDDADRGSIRVSDYEVTSLSRTEQVAYRRRIGFVFQRFHLLPALSALDNVAAPLLPRRTAFDKIERARELLQAVGLARKAESVPSRLSGGEQQRVAIARALMNDPGLLLADEPTGNLDSATSSEIIELLLHLREERAMTVLVATHDPVVAARSDRIITLSDGSVVDDVFVERRAGEDLLGRIGRLDLRS
jgi:putative ABC transport system ATP-binding protein